MALPSSISVYTDNDEYSRYEVDRKSIRCSIYPTGTGWSGQACSVQVVKSRRAKDEVVGSYIITLSETSPNIVTFNLEDLVDSDHIPKTRKGLYLARASVTDGVSTVSGDSSDFYITPITVANFKKKYLFGTDQRAFEVKSIKNQPSRITGVTVTSVSKTHPVGWFTLSYNYTDKDTSGASVTPVYLISWCGGPSETLTPSQSTYLLRKGQSNDYIEIEVNFPALLTKSMPEEIFIDNAILAPDKLRSLIDDAYSWVEKVVLGLYLEPTKVVTEADTGNLALSPGSTDIPVFTGVDWDEKVNAVSYRRPNPAHWICFDMPYKPILKFETLYGKTATVNIIDIDTSWIEFSEQGGLVELVPFQQQSQFNYLGLLWVNAVHGPMPIPNFWNFKAIVGFRTMPGVIKELIEKKAAIDALLIAGQAYRGGLSSSSISRDGVSEGVSYLNSGPSGLYSGTISTFQTWIDTNVSKIRGTYLGPSMAVLGS